MRVAVGAVAVGHRAADVDDDRVARARSPGRRARGAGWRRWGRWPTMTKSTRRVARARIASAMSAPTSRSVRPGAQPLGHPRVHAVDGRAGRGAARRPRRASCASAARAGPARRARCSAPGIAARSAQRPSRPTCGRRAPTALPRRAAAERDQRVRVVGLAPGRRSRRRARRAGEASAAGQLQPRHDQNGSPSAGSTRQVSRSSGIAS